MFLELLRNLAILLALCMAYTMLFQSRDRNSKMGRFILGLLFGTAAMCAILTPAALFPGVLIDGRAIFISMAGLFGGGLTALVAALMAVGCRMALGGPGALVGYGIIVSAALLGVGYHYFLLKQKLSITKPRLYVFGLIVHIDMLLLLLALPNDIKWQVISKVALPILLIYPVATVLIGRLLLVQDERSVSAQKLKKSEARLSSILNVAPVGIGMVKNRVFTQANPRMCEMTGYRHDELMGQSSRMIYPTEEEFLRVGEEKYGHILEHGTRTVETQWQCKSGEIKDILLSSTAVNPQRLSDGVTFTALDITERKKAERELLESEARYKALHNATFGGIAIHNKGLILECNQGLAEITGYSESELVGMDGLLLIAEESRQKVVDNITSGAEEAYEVTGVRKNGEKYPLRLDARNIPYKGLPVRVVEFRDITARKEAEEALVKQKGLLEKAQELGRIGTWELDLEKNQLYWTDENCRIFGAPPGTVASYDIFMEKVHPDDRESVDREWSAALQGAPYDIEHRLLIDGQLKWVREKADVEFNENGQAVRGIGFTQDITDRKRAEEERRKARELLQIVMDNLPVGLAVNTVDPSVEFQYMNENFCRFYRTTRDALSRPDAFWDVVYEDPEYREEIKARVLEDCASGDLSRMCWENIPITRTGEETAYINAYNVPIMDGELIISTVTDVTDRRNSEQQVEWLSRFPEENPNPVLRIEKGGTIIYANNGADILLRAWERQVGDTLPDELFMVVQNAMEAGLLKVEKDYFDQTFSLIFAPVVSEGYVNIYGQDITDRMQAEESLRTSEVKFRALVESSSDWIWEVDENGLYSYASPQVEQILGYKPEELIGTSPFDLMARDDADRISREFLDLKEKALPIVRVKNVNLHRDGHEVILESSGVPIYDAAGQAVGYRGIDRDITERTQAEKQLQESLQLLALHVEQTPLAVVRWDLDFKVEEWNPAAEEMFGYSREEALGRPGTFILPEEIHAHICETWKNLLAHTGGARSTNENVTKAGNTILCEWYNTPLVDSSGKGIGVASQVMDITDRRKSEEERDRLMLAIEQAAEIVVITDADAMILYVNPAFERVTGYSRDEVLGQNPRILQSGQHSDMFYKKMWNTLTAGNTWTGRLVNKRKDGSIYTEDATISPVRGSNGEIVNYVAAKRDVSHEQELEDQLRHAQKMEAVGQMAGGIAHDFNNLLQVISGYVELSEMSLEPGDELSPAITQIGKAAQRGKGLINQLLAFSRRQVIKPQDLDLNDLIDPLLTMMRGLIGEHIDLEFIKSRQLGTVHADRGLVEQALMNLCVNARDAMPTGGKLIIETENVLIDGEYARIHTWATPGRYVLLSITDTGCGMDAETLDRIFEPFFTTKEVGKGTGLGLSTVFGIVKQHQGHVNVYSEPDKGTIFKIYLPTVERKAQEVSREVRGPVVGGNETILIAEDDETVLVLAEHLLTEAGYTVLTAADGEEAVRVFEQNADKIDALMFDVVMPRLGGKQAVDRILELRPGLPHLFASGYSENAVHTNFIQKRGLHLLNKPYQTETLLRKIREVLDGK